MSFYSSSELPDAPYDVRVVRVNSSSAELKWTIGFNGNSPLDYIVMSYYQSGDDDDGKSSMSGSKSGEILSNIR